MKIKDIKLFFYIFIFFVITIFISDIFFVRDKSEIEEEYIDLSYNYNSGILVDENLIEKIKTEQTLKEKYEAIIIEKIKKQKELELNSASKVKIVYFPESFEKELEWTSKLNLIWNLILSAPFKDKFLEFKIELYKNKADVRWKMKDKTIKIFWVNDLSDEEFLWVFIHELAHYLDLYFLEKKVFRDISDIFYNISWDNTKIVKKWLWLKDFVSGYAMTNKYEDFAESFVYYVLHNKDFLNKTKNSNILKEKYDFFWKYIFRNSEFIGTDFSPDQIILDYYRDITKINFLKKNFLNYLKS